MIETGPLLTDSEVLRLGREIASDMTCHSGERVDPATGIRRPLTNIEMHALCFYRQWRRQRDADDYE